MLEQFKIGGLIANLALFLTFAPLNQLRALDSISGITSFIGIGSGGDDDDDNDKKDQPRSVKEAEEASKSDLGERKYYYKENAPGGIYKEKGADIHGTNAKMQTLVSVITLIAIGFSAIIMGIRCNKSLFKTPSALIFVITSIIFFGAEIYYFLKYQKASNRSMEIDRSGAYQEQYDAMKKAESVTKKAAKLAKQKAWVQTGVAVGFGLAAGVALIETFLKKEPFTCFDSTSMITPSFLLDLIIEKAYASEESFLTGKTGEILKLIGLGGGIGVGAVLALVKKGKIIKPVVDFAMKNAITRGLLFAVAGGLAGTTSFLTHRQAKLLEERAKGYNRLASAIDGMKKGGYEVIDQELVPLTPADLSAQKIVEENQEKGIFFTGGGNTPIIVDKTCSCQKEKNCKKDTAPTFTTQGFGVPNSFAGANAMMPLMGNSLFSGNLTGAGYYGSALGRYYAGRIKKDTKKLEQLKNQELQKQGQTPIPFEKIQNQLEKKMKKQVQQAIAKGLLPLNQVPAQGPEILLDPKIPKDPLAQIIKNEPAPTPPKEIKQNDPAISFNFGEEEEKHLAEDMVENTESSVSDSAYEYSTNDINPQDSSLFQLLSNRYLKTAYPRFFQERPQ
jgi:hypothetical protein